MAKILRRCSEYARSECPARRNIQQCDHYRPHIQTSDCKSSEGSGRRQCISWGDVSEDGKDKVLQCTCIKVN